MKLVMVLGVEVSGDFGYVIVCIFYFGEDEVRDECFDVICGVSGFFCSVFVFKLQFCCVLEFKFVVDCGVEYSQWIYQLFEEFDL